jgi:hypothetical protein
MVGRVRVAFAVVVLALAVSSIIILALSSTQVTPKPFLTRRGFGYELSYFNVSTLNHPVVIFRGFMGSAPVPFTISLFAITPRHMYTIGYYSGYGLVTVNLTGSLIRYIAGRWVSEFNGAFSPSLIAFITYGEGNRTWTVIATIPYNPGWVINQKPVEITVNAYFSAVKPAIVMPIRAVDPRHVGSLANAAIGNIIRPSMLTPPPGGASGSVYGYTYVGSCIGNSNIAPPPPPQNPPSCYGLQCYYWSLQQCSEFNGSIPLLFVGWSQNAIQSINGIFIDDITGTAQSGSGLFGTLNNSGALVLVGPTYTFSQSYIIESPIGSQVCIVYGPSLTFTEGICPANNVGSPIYYVPSSGFFYIGLPGYVAYVAFQEYYSNGLYTIPMNNWANGTEPLSLLPSDFITVGNYLFVYPYIDVGNGSITGEFTGILYLYNTYNQLIINLDDGYYYWSGAQGSECSSPPYGYQELSSNLAYVEYSLSNIMTTYQPNPVGIVYLLGSLLLGAYTGGSSTIVNYVITGLNEALTIAGSFINTNLVNQNQFSIGANVYVYFNPSSSTSFYITLIGSPQATNPSGSSSVYPSGMIVNASDYYLGVLECNT